MVRVHTDRSRIETKQRCSRLRFLEYHERGTGIVPAKKALPLVVGGSVHKGLEVLLTTTSNFLSGWLCDGVWSIERALEALFLYPITQFEEQAVAAALADFHQHSSTLALDLTEQAAMQQSGMQQPDYLAQMAQSLGTTVEDAGVGALAERVQASQSDFERYLAQEQAALVEAMVRAYARRRLRPLLEQYEVLEVEREGEWKLSQWYEDHEFDPMDGNHCIHCGNHREDAYGSGCSRELWFMSRPDALLRERQSNQLFILSFKTTGSWDIRKERDAQHDMQGLSEGVEVERRLGEWWQQLRDGTWAGEHHKEIARRLGTTQSMIEYLDKTCYAPPRILGIRYEYLLKGDRWKDKDLSARFGMEVRSQRSHLIRQYVATSVPQSKKGPAPFNHGDVCFSWEYTRLEDQKSSTLAWQNWHSRSVWENESIKEWIDKMDQAEVVMSGEDYTVGMCPRELGWKSAAQAMGITESHPLDSVFVPPIIVFRNDDELRDWVEQVESIERSVAINVEKVNAAQDEGEKRHSLNVLFPMTRRACSYPVECPYAKGICYASEDARRDPIGTGNFVARIPNHPMEVNDGSKAHD